MITIGCTKKLLEKMKISSPAQPNEADPLFAWTANVAVVDRRTLLLFTHNESRLSIVYHGVKAKDLKSIADLFRNGLKQTMLASNINPALVEWYCAQCNDFAITKTAGPQAVARSNKAMANAKYQVEDLSSEARLCLAEASFINKLIHSINKNEYKVPANAFASMIADKIGHEGPPMIYPGFQIKAVLDGSVSYEAQYGNEGSPACCLTICANDSFRDLRSELHWAFGIRESYTEPEHIHAFVLPDEKGRDLCLQNFYYHMGYLPDCNGDLEYKASFITRLADLLEPGLSFPYFHLNDDLYRITLTVESQIEDMGTSRASRIPLTNPQPGAYFTN